MEGFVDNMRSLRIAHRFGMSFVVAVAFDSLLECADAGIQTLIVAIERGRVFNRFASTNMPFQVFAGGVSRPTDDIGS